jgi:uncharacterized protein YuzE
MAKAEQVKLIPERIEIEYHKRADTLYIAFDRENAADDSELTDNDVLIRYKDRNIVGLTILHFSERQNRQRLA